jgi:hypothetical protein
MIEFPRCPGCQTRIKDSWIYCGSCGVKLYEAAVAARMGTRAGRAFADGLASANPLVQSTAKAMGDIIIRDIKS